MDQRTKNRIREHEGHGWIVAETTHIAKVDMSDRILMVCPCGWRGWINNG